MEDYILLETIDKYSVYYVLPNKEKGFNFGYLMAVSQCMEENAKLIVETNNFESPNYDELIKDALGTITMLGKGLINTNAPAIVPILPSTNGVPYFQQLSKECFSNDLYEEYQRIDIQVINMIEDARNKINQITEKSINNKIFLKGYSSSGIFAQRFALLHPDKIDSLCVGGAAGSIPVPMSEINGISLLYPTGTKDIANLTGVSFNENAYKEIKFFNYVGEKEELTKSDTRLDEFGNAAPMHDMTYMERSTPKDIGTVFRKIFGYNMMDRFNNINEIYQSLGYDINTKVFAGKYHNSINGQDGLGELANIYVYNFYMNSTILEENLNNKNV